MYSGNCYSDFPELYDVLYQRYLHSAEDFARLVAENSSRGGLILDLAAGTGEVSIPLLARGFRVTSIDASRGMLGELKNKAIKLGIKNVVPVVADMGMLAYKDIFDVVCIRQAINYFLGTPSLRKGLKKIRRALKDGGAFVFNAPNYKGQKEYPSASNLYKNTKCTAFVVETNALKNRLLRHEQYSLLWDYRTKPLFIRDENTFFLFTKKEFSRCLRDAGFSKIQFREAGKTLTCIAIK